MLLAIDEGNTNTLFAVHDGERWIAEWRSATHTTRTADEYAVWLSALLEMKGLTVSDLTDCIISSLVPQAEVVRFEDVAHFIPFQAPERFVAELRRANLDEKAIKIMLELGQDFRLPALA